VATAAAVVFAVALMVTLVDTSPDRERTVAPRPAPILLQLDGELTRIDLKSWEAPARGPGGAGTFTMIATDDLTAPSSRDRIPFVWISFRGWIGGCITNASEPPRAGRVAWNAHGRVTVASGALARYRGRDIRVAGMTRISTSEPTRAAPTRLQPVPGVEPVVIAAPTRC
jgi:hypothetical protein